MWILNSLLNKNKKTDKTTTGGKVKNEEEKSMKELYHSNEAIKDKQQKGIDKKIFKYEQAYQILQKPLVTEKVTNLGVHNKYVFAVANNANKVEVAKAIHHVYGIKPVKVNMIKMMGKITKHGKISGKRKNWKKAIITLPIGETIKVYEGV